MKAFFGPAGNSESFLSLKGHSTQAAPGWLSGLGLDAYEYQCGRGVRIGGRAAARLGGEARRHRIALSVHAPYYISLSNGAPERVASNISYILQSAGAAAEMGAARIVVHAGAAKAENRREALLNARRCLNLALGRMEEEGLSGVTVCVETMGKVNVFGALPEVLELCASDGRLLPCVDFGHLYARSLGALKTGEDFAEVFDSVEKSLGPARAKRMHIHFSKIQYGERGEIRHLNFSDEGFGPPFAPAAEIMRERGYTPVVICESRGMQAEDALFMKKVFFGE